LIIARECIPLPKNFKYFSGRQAYSRTKFCFSYVAMKTGYRSFLSDEIVTVAGFVFEIMINKQYCFAKTNTFYFFYGFNQLKIII
jgi:hypothetical protein